MNKRILFVTQQLGCGGVEKALANFIELVDRKKYDCNLLVIDASGEFRELYPDWLEIKEYNCPEYVKSICAKYYSMPILNKNDSVKIKLSKLFWKVAVSVNKVTVKVFEKNIIFALINALYRSKNEIKNYDMIIDYHGYGVYTTYLASKQKGMKKISWIHEQTIYNAYKCIKKCYPKFDKIFGVSRECCENFLRKFPQLEDKVDVLYNYLDVDMVKSKATEPLVDMVKEDDATYLVSVGRVSDQKKFERVVETAAMLKKDCYKFRWIVVGDGDQLEMLKELSVSRKVEDVVLFVGFQSNPYKYMNIAEIYVQTSLVEGFCTTISEAIILGKPVVTTGVSGVDEQLGENEGGIITEHNIESITDAIEKLIDNDQMRNEMAIRNMNYNMDYKREVEKVYNIFDATAIKKN